MMRVPAIFIHGATFSVSDFFDDFSTGQEQSTVVCARRVHLPLSVRGFHESKGLVPRVARKTAGRRCSSSANGA